MELHGLQPDLQLAEIRRQHDRMRRDVELARAFRASKGKHRFRSRQRRT